jgi:phosphohistidine phosphatase
MARTLVLIRHAKSSWSNPLQSDFDRELNDRGKGEAEEMGKKLKKSGLIPDLIISSSAKRTKQTAKRIAKETGYEPDEIRWEENLYHCVPAVFEETIRSIKEKAKTVFIVAHNPGITEFSNQLSDGFYIDNMPTCGIVAAHTDAEEWPDFSAQGNKVFLFEYPAK